MSPLFCLLHVLAILITFAEQLQINSSSLSTRVVEDRVEWPWSKRSRRGRSAPAVWDAAVPDYSNVVLSGSTVYLYAVIFLDLKTLEHYSNDWDRAATEVVKLVRESNKYFYQLNIRIAVADVLPTNRSDLSLYTFEDFHNAHSSSLPYHNFAVLISLRYAGGLAFVNGFCSSKNVMMVGFYPHNPQAMASIFFHEACHLIGVSHTHENETLDVPNCPCNAAMIPRSSAQIQTKTGESMLSSTVRHVEGCLKIPGFDHNCTTQLAVNLLYRSRCLPTNHRSAAQNRVEGYGAESKTKPSILSICGNGIVESGEDCDCGLPKYCTLWRDWNCESLSCQRKIPLWILVLGSIGFGVVFFTILFFYTRLKLAAISAKKQYASVQVRMMAPPATTQSEYLENMSHLVHYLNRLFRALKSLLCKKKKPASVAEGGYNKTKMDSTIIVVRSAQQLPGGRHKIERPKFPPPSLPIVGRPKGPPPPRPSPPQILKNYSYLEQNIDYKFADFEED